APQPAPGQVLRRPDCAPRARTGADRADAGGVRRHPLPPRLPALPARAPHDDAPRVDPARTSGPLGPDGPLRRVPRAAELVHLRRPTKAHAVDELGVDRVSRFTGELLPLPRGTW